MYRYGPGRTVLPGYGHMYHKRGTAQLYVRMYHKCRYSSIARGALRSRRCLRGPPSQAPAESQVSSKHNTRIKRRNFRMHFCADFVNT